MSTQSRVDSSTLVSDFINKYGVLHPDLTKDLLELQKQLAKQGPHPVEYANLLMRGADVFERILGRFLS